MNRRSAFADANLFDLAALLRPLLPWWRAMVRTHDRMKGGR